MIGPIVCSAALAVGGVCGAAWGRYLPERIKDTLPLVFGVAIVSIGSTLVGKATALHVVVLALILGTAIGELFFMERWLGNSIKGILQWSKTYGQTMDNVMIVQYVTLVSAFCFGSMGIFGALAEGVTGKPEILLTKAVLDLFSGIIFGAVLGVRVSLIALPQFLILTGLYYSASFVMPLATTEVLNDFSACGGVIFLATGLRMCGIKFFPVVNMLPALLVVGPLSYMFTKFF